MPMPRRSGEAILVQSSKGGRRFESTSLESATFDLDGPTTKVIIQVNSSREFQQILGWGGAFTDASGINMNSLSAEMTDRVVASYFGENGLQYNFGRVPIAGCDFSTRPYSYDDTPGVDYDLENWSLAPEDYEHKIPLIRRAMELLADYNETLKLFGSPWSPPRWMKDNNNVTRGHLINTYENYRAYANYLVKFYKTYEELGIDFWGGTVQNEPVQASSPSYYFNSLQLDNASTIKLVANFLGPALEAAGFSRDKFKLMIGDEILGEINSQVSEVMKWDKVRKYISGLAFHWYASASKQVPYDLLKNLTRPIEHDIDFVIMSEACNGFRPEDKHVDLGSWERGELYGSDIIEDLLRGTGAWIDWNLALDEGGGPNWVSNWVDSPIIVNGTSNEFYKQPMYYVLGHFSRFLRPGSVRVETRTPAEERSDLLVVAAKDGSKLAVNILNRSSEAKQIMVVVDSTTTKTVSVEAKSINSVVFRL